MLRFRKKLKYLQMCKIEMIIYQRDMCGMSEYRYKRNLQSERMQKSLQGRRV